MDTYLSRGATGSGTSGFARWWARNRTSTFWMTAIAFGIRVAAILLLHTYKFRSTDQNFGFGWEMGRIGEALASGQGFSNPFHGVTGPTAWEPPLYPFIIGVVFKAFGIYSRMSSFVLLTLNSFFSALTCIPVFRISRRCFGERVAVACGWTWALLPYVMYWCTRWVWETSLSALLLALIFWLALTMEERDGLKPWLEFGALWGVAALNSPVLLSFLPVSGLWAWYHRAKLGKRSIAGVVLSSLVFFCLITPWLVRNHHVFGKWIFLRSNFGAELRMGNGPWANGTWMYWLHPTQNDLAYQEYTQMGEIGYVAERKRQAMAFINEDPMRFLRICMKKFYYYWGGVPRSADIWQLAQFKNSLFLASSVLCFWGLLRALRQRRAGAWLFFWLILLFPAVYYVVFPHARYRHPIEPEMGILGVFLITEARSRSMPPKPGATN
jgi:4-amino-4-deoxy-L-arabinose transferase-like glycosyltransferase